MAAFIQKPVTFEQFEITTLVFQFFRLNTKGSNLIHQCEKIPLKKKPTYLPYFLKTCYRKLNIIFFCLVDHIGVLALLSYIYQKNLFFAALIELYTQ